MKKQLPPFILGIVVGVILVAVATFFLHPKVADEGFSKLSSKGECFFENSIQVVQVLNKHYALAIESTDDSPNIFKNLFNLISGGNIAALKVDDTSSLYDGVSIKIAGNECFRIVGNYSYADNENVKHTVPAVILDKK